MQHRSFVPQRLPTSKQQSSKSSDSRTAPPAGSAPVSASRPASKATPAPSQDQLVRVFNTALVSTKSGKKRDFSSELYELAESSAFKSILNAVRQLSRVQGVSERQAAEEVIQTFRKMDELWGEYIFREGLDKLRCPKT